MRPPIDRVAVVVPARDEAALIGSCLDALSDAAEELGRLRPALRCEVIVVADACRDDTASRAAERVRVLESALGNVGAARAAGVRALIPGDEITERSWIALTDADSRVPRNWLTHQLDLADAGADAVIGTVTPDFGPDDALLRRRWSAAHRRGRPNGHVHGASLGIRGSAYRAAGGFEPLSTGEDVALVERLRLLGAAIVASDDHDVLTSARRVGRAPDGYAEHLARLGGQRHGDQRGGATNVAS